MSKSLVSDQAWVQMTEAQKVAAVIGGHASLKQMSEGLLDGSEQLRSACRETLAHTAATFENLPLDNEQDNEQEQPDTSLDTPNTFNPVDAFAHATSKARHTPANIKNRFGLPDGFVPRLQRYGRSVLLELDVYRLPNGQEFIACRPTGTLGSGRHLYALLTNEQYLQGRRGSVYVRTDGRIFDYSVNSPIPLGDLFDTGYTISDLERTGRYAPVLRTKKKKRPPLKVKRATAGR